MFWARSPKGKNMPLDATPHPEGKWMIEEGDEGKPNAVKASNTHGALEGDMARYNCHFETCPNADQHRRDRQPGNPQRGAPNAPDQAVEVVELRERLEKCREAFLALRKENEDLKRKLKGRGE
jgi:hypothetical protein